MYVLYAYAQMHISVVHVCRGGDEMGRERSGKEEEEEVGEGKVSNLSLKDLMVCMWLACGSRLWHHGNGARVVQGICCMANMWLVVGEGGWNHAPLHGVRRWRSTYFLLHKAATYHEVLE